MTESSNKYDLEERVILFSQFLLETLKIVQIDYISRPIVDQLIRSGTSIGANYCEANNAASKKDFRNKIYISKKEAQETKYWLRLLADCCPEKKESIRKLWKETHELTCIFQKIINSLEKRK